ncbi:hypothetical protein Tco_0643570 [Tanacetum coccineum]
MSTSQASAQLTNDQLVHVNCQYKIASPNERVDLNNLPSPAASKIIREMLKRHCLKDSLTLSTSTPVFYMQELWHTLQLADS